MAPGFWRPFTGGQDHGRTIPLASLNVIWRMQAKVFGAERHQWSYNEKVRLVETRPQAGEIVCGVARQHAALTVTTPTFGARLGRVVGDP